MKPVLLCVSLFLIAGSPLLGQVFDERFDAWPIQTRIGGTLVIAEELDDVSILSSAVRLPGDDTSVLLWIDNRIAADAVQELADTFDGVRLKLAGYSADNNVSAELKKALGDCKLLCWQVPVKLTQAEIDRLLGARELLQGYLDSGGKIVLLGGIAALAGKLADSQVDELGQGLNLLPEAILQTGAAIDSEQLLQHLSKNARTVGVSLESNTALVLNGRIAQVVGDGATSFMLPSGEFHEVRTQTIKQPSRRQRPPQYLVDWTEWRRDSIDRTLPQFPPAIPPSPVVENGTLLIVGGGGTPGGLMDRFVELAGGPDNAKLVYVPCSESLELPSEQGMVTAWRKMGVQSATFIHTKDRNKANSDADFLSPLQTATGIWFGGGRQWNMADSYYGTEAHRLMKEVLKRGGVIGGSSAGASIQARYLARATPIENFRIMAPGYERGGLGFIGGVAIDQHFSQRGRQKDMTQLVDRYPQLLGIGLDEATAIEVQKSVAKVSGKGRVFFYDRSDATMEREPDYLALPAGSVFDLLSRKVILDATQDTLNEDSQDKQADEK